MVQGSCDTEADCRMRLGVPDAADQVMVVTESSHWDPNWLMTSEHYHRWCVRPALDAVLRHESELTENGTPRKVSLEMRAVAIGDVTQSLASMALGDAALFAGFVAQARNGRGWLFHITQVDPQG